MPGSLFNVTLWTLQKMADFITFYDFMPSETPVSDKVLFKILSDKVLSRFLHPLFKYEKITDSEKIIRVESRRYQGEWPRGLMYCSKNQKVPGSNPTRHSAGLREPTSFQGSWWPTGRKCKIQWSTSGEWGCPLNNGPKLAVGQPNSS